MTDLPIGRHARNRKLAGLPIGMAGRAAVGLARKLAGAESGRVDAEFEQKTAAHIFRVLGELKGGAMKLGQILSVMEAAVPAEHAGPYRDALTRLQSSAAPMPTESMYRVVDHELGTRWRERFISFEEEPVAAASIGQVHRAIWSDGRAVAVKVQYPGADQALRADIKPLSTLAKWLAKVMPTADVTAIVSEIEESIEAELDYRAEADNQRVLATAFAGHRGILVPPVVASSPRVLVTEWINGIALSDVIRDGTAEQRNSAGTLLTEFLLAAPALAGLLHSDPHPGNYKILDDGRLGVLDFGACGSFPGGLPESWGSMLSLARDERYEDLVDALETNDFVLPNRDVTADEIADYLRPISDPLQQDTFHFTREWLRNAAATASGMADRSSRDTARSLDLPPGHAMIVRVMLGSIGVLSQLDAEVSFSKIATEWLPGFSASAN
ncbi:MAG: AarF/ABC1/UbiB kinase family protein [Rhodococcus sp. (in: high G+C Gram-positive bacteria)]